MDAIEKVHGDVSPDRRLAVDRAELVWRGFERAVEDRVPSDPIHQAAGSHALGDSSVEHRARRRMANVEFEVKSDTGEIVVKVLDSESGEVIRTVPPDELNRLIQTGENWLPPLQVLI